MRRSPGSPSQMIAALLRRGPRTWRSTQLTLALSVPPTNHFACGGFQSSTLRPRREPLELLGEARPEAPRDRARRARRRPRRGRSPARGTRPTARTCGLPGGDRRSRRGLLVGHRPIRILDAGSAERDPAYASLWRKRRRLGRVRRARAARRCGRTPRRARRRASAKIARHEAGTRRTRTRSRSGEDALAHRLEHVAHLGRHVARVAQEARPRAAAAAAPSADVRAPIETISQTNAPTMPARDQPGERAAPDGDRARIVLLIEIGGEHAAADHPQAAAAVGRGRRSAAPTGRR